MIRETRSDLRGEATYSAPVIRSTRAVPALVAVLLLGACGGGANTASSVSSPSSTSSTAVSASKADDEQAIRKAFEDYRAALRAKDGEAAVKVVSDRMLSLYLEFKEMALTMPEDGVRQLGASTSLVVYTLRAEFGAAELRGMTSADVVAESVSRGLVSQRSVEVVELDTVTVAGDTAKASMMSSRGGSERLEMPFYREFGSWKFDGLALLPLADEALATLAEQQGVTVEQVVDRTLTALYGAERLPELKQPLER